MRLLGVDVAIAATSSGQIRQAKDEAGAADQALNEHDRRDEEGAGKSVKAGARATSFPRQGRADTWILAGRRGSGSNDGNPFVAAGGSWKITTCGSHSALRTGRNPLFQCLLPSRSFAFLNKFIVILAANER